MPARPRVPAPLRRTTPRSVRHGVSWPDTGTPPPATGLRVPGATGRRPAGGQPREGRTTGKRAQERRERAEQKGGTSTAHHPLLPPSLARCAAAGRVGGRVAAGPPGRPRGGVMSLDGGPVAARRPAPHPFPLLSGVEKRQTPVRDRPVETGSRRRCDYSSRGGTRTFPPPPSHALLPLPHLPTYRRCQARGWRRRQALGTSGKPFPCCPHNA